MQHQNMQGPRSIELFSLKEYWFYESRDVKTDRQNFINACIDQILDPKSAFCQTREIQFKTNVFQTQIEYGDYLVVALDDNDIVTAFAVCADHPNPKFNLWSDFVTEVHGYFEVSVICSIRPNQAKPMFDTMVAFAQKTLLRRFVTLQSLDIPKLLETYKSWGLVEKNKKHHIFEFNLQRKNK